jgi:hypothetical protein
MTKMPADLVEREYPATSAQTILHWRNVPRAEGAEPGLTVVTPGAVGMYDPHNSGRQLASALP